MISVVAHLDFNFLPLSVFFDGNISATLHMAQEHQCQH